MLSRATTFGLLTCFTALAPFASADDRNSIVMMIRAPKSSSTVAVKSVAFDRSGLGRNLLHAAGPTEAKIVTIELDAATGAAHHFKVGEKLTKIDLVLYATDDKGRRRLRSQVEIGRPVISEYAIAEVGGKKVATLKLSTKVILITETARTTNSDWK